MLTTATTKGVFRIRAIMSANLRRPDRRRGSQKIAMEWENLCHLQLKVAGSYKHTTRRKANESALRPVSLAASVDWRVQGTRTSRTAISNREPSISAKKD